MRSVTTGVRCLSEDLCTLGAHTVKFMCVRHLAEFFGTEEHVLRAKIEELKDNNCPLFR